MTLVHKQVGEQEVSRGRWGWDQKNQDSMVLQQGVTAYLNITGLSLKEVLSVLILQLLLHLHISNKYLNFK